MVGNAQIDAARALFDALESVVPPQPALEYYKALIANTEEYIAGIEEQSAAIVTATTPQQIAIANAQGRFRVQANDRELAAVAVNLPPQVAAAMAKLPGCRSQPQPLTPGIAPPGGPRPGGT